MTGVLSETLTPDDLDRIAYGGGTRELVDGCLVITRTSGHWTVDDLDDLPEDGRKHELLDGQVVVSPAPRRRHQRAVVRLAVRLEAVLPPEVEALVSPVDVTIMGDLPTRLQPDVVVVPADGDPEQEVARPLVVVEVLSPSTRRFDLGRKRAAYARHGIPTYVLVDPRVPSVTVLVLDGAGYRQVAYGEGDAPVRLEGAVTLELSAADLVRSRR